MAGIVKCINGHENMEGDNFCRICGERLSGGQITCKGCGAVIDSGSNFCGKCGKSVVETKPGNIEGMLWQRGPEDFATRVDADDLSGILKKGIIVEQGTKALLFVNGAFAEILQPGRYDLGGLASKLKNFEPYRTAAAILMDSGDAEFQFTLADVTTKDPLKIGVTCKVVVQIDNPTLFFNNVMKGRQNYLLSQLRGSLYDELQNAFNEVVGRKSVTELNWDLSLKAQFEVSVENHLRTTFQRNGFSFIQLRTIDYKFQAYDKIKGIQQEAFLLVSEDEAQLQKRKRLFDVYDQNQLQDIIEEAKEVEYREKRQKLWADMRVLVNSDKMNEVKSADDLEAFVHEIDKSKMLRDEEVKDLVNTFAQSGLRRDFLLKKITLEQNIEYDGIGLVGKEENELKRFEVEAKRRRSVLEQEIHEFQQRKDAERTARVGDAEAEGKIRDVEREQDRKEMQDGLDALERIKKMKAQEKRDEMEIETERLQRLSALGIEALITGSGETQAALLADLKKTELLKGMTDEQILAMGAKDSPELAKAFQEKFRGLSAAKQEELYREMMSQKDKSMQTMQEMFNKALETQRDATVGVAQGGKVVYPPPGQGYPGTGGVGGVGVYNVTTPGAGTEAVICQKCKSRVQAGEKSCWNCGNEMF